MNYHTHTGRTAKQSAWNLSNLSVTVQLIIFTCLVSIILFILEYIYPKSIDYLALYPSHIMQGTFLWTLITHMFVHGGIMHLVMNMFVLFSLGGLCERIIGKKRFIWFYLISGMFAGLLSVILSYYFGYGILEKVFGSANVYMVGASGAIFAIAGLFVMLLPKLRFSIIFLPFFTLPAYVMVPLVLVLTWLATIAADLPVGNVAHLGGFLAGLAYGYYLRMKYKRKILMLQNMFR